MTPGCARGICTISRWVTPVFYRGRGIGWFANTCHAMDIGGRTLGADAREVFEEGLHIPMMKLFRGGQINQDLIAIVKANVREPDQVVGDLYAQQAGNDVGAAKPGRDDGGVRSRRPRGAVGTHSHPHGRSPAAAPLPKFPMGCTATR